MMKVAVNDFVRRQIKGTGKTYSSTLTFEKIAAHAEVRMLLGFYRKGYRDGVRIVDSDPKLADQFFCPYVEVTPDTKLEATVVKRQEFEEPYIQIRALNGTPLKSRSVDLILYRHDVLLENNEHTTDSDWELISINAIPESVEELPMGPVTMMRNQLQSSGGTKAHYSSEEWANSIHFWQNYAALKSG